MKQSLIVVAALVALAAAPLAAQGPQLTRFAPVDAGTLRSYRVPETHWKEGAAVGGMVGAVLVGMYANGMCQYSDVSDGCGGALITGVVIGGLLGFGVGGLVGGMFPKD